MSFFLLLIMSWTSAYGLTPSASLRAISDQDFRRQLRQSPEWISAWFVKTDSVPLLKMTKSWALSKSQQQIRETSSLSGPAFEQWMDDASAGDNYPWRSAQSPLDSQHLHSIWSSQSEPPESVKQVTPTSFLVEFSDAFILIFAHQSPAEPGPTGLPYPTFETPWPFHPDLIFGKHLFGPAPGPRRAVVSKGLRQYGVTSRFPRALVPVISKASRTWNIGLEQNMFEPRPSHLPPPSFWECFLPGYLCFDWIGNDSVPLKGLSAATQFTYHPVTGEKLGSLVVFFNTLNESTFHSLSPSRVVSPLRLPQPGPNALKETLSILFAPEVDVRLPHPQPLELVQSFLIHELGHDLGLRHDFAASIHSKTDQDMEPSSVMDYFPWPIVHLVKRPGPVDIARVKTLLGQSPRSQAQRQRLASDCTDQSVGLTMECMGGDWGPPAEWILTASETAPDLQTKIQVSGGHHSFLDSTLTIREGIVRLLSEPNGKSPLTLEMTQRLSSRLNQMPASR